MSGKLYATIYDRVMGDAVFPVIRASFEGWRQRLGLKPRSAADVGCGTGRFIRHLSRSVPTVYGVDTSGQMLKILKKRITGPDTAIFKQDMRCLRLPRQVDLITANFDTLNYVTRVHDLRYVLEAFNRNLLGHGCLYFDVLTGDGDRPRPGVKTQAIRLPDVFSNWRIRTGKNSSQVTIDSVGRAPDGSVIKEREHHLQRWYSAHLLTRLLRHCGFRVLGMFRFGTNKPAHGSAFWIQVIAQKPITK